MCFVCESRWRRGGGSFGGCWLWKQIKIKLGIKSVALSWQELWVGFEDAKLALRILGGCSLLIARDRKSFMLALVLGGKEALILVSFIRGVLARNHSAVGD